jgi:hypothetical protein
MSYLRSLLLTILAVLALTSPSLAVGAAVSLSEAPRTIALADDEARAPAFEPCSRQGGKWLPACHPDLGLPVPAAGPPQWPTARVPVPPVAMKLPDRAPKIEPPPPRRR